MHNVDKTEEGSPPHLRGKRTLPFCGENLSGITPAPAGKTGEKKIEDEREKDHPRTCGENSFQHLQLQNRDGSPPHLRGKPELKNQTLEKTGITPAPAGKT